MESLQTLVFDRSIRESLCVVKKVSQAEGTTVRIQFPIRKEKNIRDSVIITVCQKRYDWPF